VSAHRAPLAAPFLKPVFDFSEEALRQSKMRGFYYLTYASFFGSYYFFLVQPHSMYLMASLGMSLFMLSGFLNHQMVMVLSVADAQLKTDGEQVRFILYDGRTYNVPVRQILWNNNVKDKVMVNTVDEDGAARKFMFDFSKVRPQ